MLHTGLPRYTHTHTHMFVHSCIRMYLYVYHMKRSACPLACLAPSKLCKYLIQHIFFYYVWNWIANGVRSIKCSCVCFYVATNAFICLTSLAHFIYIPSLECTFKYVVGVIWSYFICVCKKWIYVAFVEQSLDSSS